MVGTWESWWFPAGMARLRLRTLGLPLTTAGSWELCAPIWAEALDEAEACLAVEGIARPLVPRILLPWPVLARELLAAVDTLVDSL